MWRIGTSFSHPRSAVGNVSGNRCESDCRSRGRGFDPGRVPYFLGDRSWNNFYGHSPPFRWIIQEGLLSELLSVTSESICTKYWLTRAVGKRVVRWTDRPAMTLDVDLGRKIVCEYDQEIPQSQTADNPIAPRGTAAHHHETPGRQIKQSNQLSIPHQDDCNTRMDIKKRTTKHRTVTGSLNGSNNKQKVNNNNRTTALERTAA